MNANCRYLDAILEQYHRGRDNRPGLSRVARRDAYNRDAELASVVSNLSTEPRADGAQRETAFRLLCLNHTSSTSVHLRSRRASGKNCPPPDILALLDDAVCYVDDAPAPYPRR